MFQEWLSMPDRCKKHFLLVTLSQYKTPDLKWKKIQHPQVYQRLSYTKERTFEMLLERLMECPKAFSFWKRKNRITAATNHSYEDILKLLLETKFHGESLAAAAFKDAVSIDISLIYCNH